MVGSKDMLVRYWLGIRVHVVAAGQKEDGRVKDVSGEGQTTQCRMSQLSVTDAPFPFLAPFLLFQHYRNFNHGYAICICIFKEPHYLSFSPYRKSKIVIYLTQEA